LKELCYHTSEGPQFCYKYLEEYKTKGETPLQCCLKKKRIQTTHLGASIEQTDIEVSFLPGNIQVGVYRSICVENSHIDSYIQNNMIQFIQQVKEASGVSDCTPMGYPEFIYNLAVEKNLKQQITTEDENSLC